MKPWFEANVRSKFVQNIHWFFVDISLDAKKIIVNPDISVLLDHAQCRDPVVAALTALWDLYESLPNKRDVIPVLVIMPLHSNGDRQTPWLCFRNDMLEPPFMPLAITTAIHDARAAGWRRAVFYSCDTAFPLEALPSTVPRAYDTTKSITVCAFKGIEWSSWNRGEGPAAASEYLKAGAPIGTTVTTTNFKGFVQRLDISVMSNSHAYGKNSCDFALALTGTQVVGQVAGRLVEWNFERALLRVHGQVPRRPLATQWMRRKLAELEKGQSEMGRV